MKHTVFIFTFLLLAASVFAQVETLSPATFNASIYHAAKQQHHKYLIDKGQYIIFSDTLSLPFVDDFSSNTLRSYKWAQNNITASYTNVFGTCLGPEGISTIQGDFISDSSYTYTYDTILQQTDSIADAPIVFTYFGPGTASCFSKAPQTNYFWKPYYRYIFNSDGTVTGNGGCNGFGGDYEVKEDQLTFGPIMSTLMACEESIMDQEGTVTQVLFETATYKIDGNTLTITKGDAALVFEAVAAQ